MPTREELFAKGLGAYGKGNLDEAITAFKDALELDPTYADAYFAMASSLNKKGHLNDAMAAIKKPIDLNPNGVLYHTELSRLYVQLKMVPEAEAAKAEAMRLQRGR